MSSSSPFSKESSGALSGPSKVAVLLLALGKPMAGRLLKYFDPEELIKISHSAQDLKGISPEELDRLVEEFSQSFQKTLPFIGTSDEVAQLLTETLLPEQLAVLSPQPEEAPAPAMAPWKALSALPLSELLERLEAEHPQVAAMVLSNLSSDLVASLLMIWPEEGRGGLLQRLLQAAPLEDEVLSLVEETIRIHWLAEKKVQADNVQGRSRLAGIVNTLEKPDAEALLAHLAQHDPEEAEKIKSLLFSFEDIVKLEKKDRGVLFDNVSTDQVVVALRDIDGDLREAVLSALASRSRRMVEAELKGEHSLKPQDISAARRAIANMALALAEKGQMVLRPPEEEVPGE